MGIIDCIVKISEMREIEREGRGGGKSKEREREGEGGRIGKSWRGLELHKGLEI